MAETKLSRSAEGLPRMRVGTSVERVGWKTVFRTRARYDESDGMAESLEAIDADGRWEMERIVWAAYENMTRMRLTENCQRV